MCVTAACVFARPEEGIGRSPKPLTSGINLAGLQASLFYHLPIQHLQRLYWSLFHHPVSVYQQTWTKPSYPCQERRDG